MWRPCWRASALRRSMSSAVVRSSTEGSSASGEEFFRSKMLEAQLPRGVSSMDTERRFASSCWTTTTLTVSFESCLKHLQQDYTRHFLSLQASNENLILKWKLKLCLEICSQVLTGFTKHNPESNFSSTSSTQYPNPTSSWEVNTRRDSAKVKSCRFLPIQLQLQNKMKK